MKTIFEKIRDREIPAKFLYETDLVMAILDISQATKGHTLVIPKHPYPDLEHTPVDVLTHIMKATLQVVSILNQAFSPVGYNYLSNQNEVSGQTVMHMHVHVIPRYEAGEIDLHFKPTPFNLVDVFNSIKPFI